MAIEIKIPSPGESITEVEMATWFVENGAMVSKNQEVGEIESEKATLPLIAEKPGRIEILVEEGETVAVGKVVARIDTEAQGQEESGDEPEEGEEQKKEQKEASEKEGDSSAKEEPGQDDPTEKKKEDPEKEKEGPEKDDVAGDRKKTAAEKIRMTPVAREMMETEGLSVDDIISGLRKITSSDVKRVMEHTGSPSSAQPAAEPSREEDRKKISQLRKKISQRLVAVKNETAMLTTFNEADMSAVMELRRAHQDKFVEAHGIKLGFMSFFTKAVTEALRRFPAVNSHIDGESVVVPDYCDIGIAVQTDKGLMVPVIRNAEILSLAAIEKQIADLAGRARKARLSIEEMSGGTFTISNGGIYGSMLSTPILNPPQSGILGMHNIVERPVAIEGEIVIRPMMYLALSYDHRVIDGKDSVSFLKAVKEYIEDPVKLLFGSGTAEETLLDI